MTQHQINNIKNNQINNISINVFLNKHCKNAISLENFIEQLQITFDDLLYTGRTNYVEGLSNILVKNLNKLDRFRRPIHCSDIKRNVLYIKNEEGWEKDKKHENIKRYIKDVENKQIQKIPEWQEREKIDIYKNDLHGMEYQKIIRNTMGGLDKEKTSVIKNISKSTKYKNE